MAEPVRARRLTDQEGRRLQQIVRRGKHESVRVRRAMIIVASASGTPVPAIARLVAADEDTVRDVVHAFNQKGLAALDPRWAGGRPRLISDEDIAVIVAAATTRPEKLGLPFTHWSLRKLAAHLAGEARRPVRVGRERLRQILHERGISFQRTRTWKESADPDKDAKLDRIEHVTGTFPDRCFAFDQFGPLSIRPCHGTCWAAKNKPARRPATYHRAHGIRYFHGCYSLADDQLWGITRLRKGGDHTLAALKSIRAARPDGAPIYVILDNLSANKTPPIRTWAARNKVNLCFTPTSASWANPIEAQFGPLRTFVIGSSDYPHHTALARRLQDYLAWRNANARHPDVLAAQRRERARIRSERQQRWGRPGPKPRDQNRRTFMDTPLDSLTSMGAKIVALSVDDEGTTQDLIAKHGLQFPVGHSADARAIADATGAFVNDDPLYLQSTGFALDPVGRVVVSVYSSGAIGRLVPEDVIGLIRYLRER